MKVYHCRICEHQFESIEHATEISGALGRGRRTYRLYRFEDGSIHDLRTITVPDRPEPVAEQVPDPQPEKVVQEVVNQDPPTPVEEDNSGGIMAAAFNKLFRQQENPDWQDGDSLEKF